MKLSLPSPLPIRGKDKPNDLTVFTTIGELNELISQGVLSVGQCKMITPECHWDYLTGEPNA